MAELIVILIPVFPLIAVMVNGLVGYRYSPDLAGKIAFGSVGLSFLCALTVFGGVVSVSYTHLTLPTILLV